MKKLDIVKVAGVALPIIGAVLSLATNWVEDKKLDDKITEKVTEALSKPKE